MALMRHSCWIAGSKCLTLAELGLSREVCNRCLRWFLWGRAKVDLVLFYLAFFDSEEFNVPGATAILDFAVVENEGFVVSFKDPPNHRLGTAHYRPSA